MGRAQDWFERKVAETVKSWDDETLAKHTIAKGDAALDYLNNTSRGNSARGIDAGRMQDLQTDPGGFVYKSEIITKKAYFYQMPIHREIVFQHNTIMDAAIKKIRDAVTAVEPIFNIPTKGKEDEEKPEVHEQATKGWKEIYGQDVLAKSVEKSIKHGAILYEPLDIPEADLEWYTNAPFFIRAWDEITSRSEYKHGLATQYFINPSNPQLNGYTIDITLNSTRGAAHPKDDRSPDHNKLHAGLFFDPDNTDDHNGKPKFLGCWDNIQDYEAIKEARNSYDEQIGNGFIVVGVPSKDYPKVKEEVKAKIKNIRREQGLVIPIDKDTPIAIEFKGSTFQIDFNADLDDIRRDIIANIGLPERWLFGDAEGAMESSGKDRLQVQDFIKTYFSKFKRLCKLLLRYHGYITSLDEIEVNAPYDLQYTDAEKAEIDNLKIQTLDVKSRFLSLDEVRDELGKKHIDPAQLSWAELAPAEDEDNESPQLNEAKTGPTEEKKKTDAEYYDEDEEEFEEDPLPEVLLLDSLVAKIPYDVLKQRWTVSKDTIAKIKRCTRDNKEIHEKTDSYMMDSVEIAPDIWSSSGLIVPAQTKYYPEYQAKFIRSPKQLTEAFERHKADILPFGVYKSNGHDEGIDVGEYGQFGEVRLDSVSEKGIYGTTVYDLTKVDEILGPENWIRKRLKDKQLLTTSIGLSSTDVPIEAGLNYEINHKLKSLVATQFPRNEKAGVD